MIRTASSFLALSFLTLTGVSAMATPAHHARPVALVASADTAAPTDNAAVGEKKADVKADKADKKDRKVKSAKLHARAKAPATTDGASPAPAAEKVPSEKSVEKGADKK